LSQEYPVFDEQLICFKEEHLELAPKTTSKGAETMSNTLIVIGTAQWLGIGGRVDRWKPT
jgi:hypothetical protein